MREDGTEDWMPREGRSDVMLVGSGERFGEWLDCEAIVKNEVSRSGAEVAMEESSSREDWSGGLRCWSGSGE